MIRQRLSNLVEGLLDRRQLRRAPGLPSQLHLSVTDRCFLPCLHCDIWKNEAEDLPTADWMQVIDRLGQWCAPASMNFVGGEPLLRSDLKLLVRQAVGNGFEVSFNTNGWLVNEKRASELCEAGASVAYISLDGMHEKTVDHSRGKAGSYAKAMAAIDHFDRLPNPRVVIASVLHAQNATEIIELLHWVEKRQLQLVVQPLYQNFGNVAYDPDWWKTSPLWPASERQLQLLDETLDILTVARLKGRPVCNEAAQLQAMKFHFRQPQKDSGVSCRAGHSDLSFDPHGRVRLCYFLEPIGTIYEACSFADMWARVETLSRRWEVSRCERHCNLLNCNFDVAS